MMATPLDATDPERAGALKHKVLARLTDLARHYRAFDAAIAEYGTGFPEQVFVDAAASEDPTVLNRVKAVERGLDQLFNYMAELAAQGLELAGVRAPGDEPNARADLRRLRDAGIIEPGLCERLVQVAAIRNRMVHDYVGLAARDTHEAARLLHAALPAFVTAYQGWLKSGFRAAP
jgi:uncharacterized protein YutE (UPF0331/DUF86 family)